MKFNNYTSGCAILSLFFLLTLEISAQGCVAIRGGSSCSSGFGNTFNLAKGEFLAGMDYRRFKSFRHFRGDEEEPHRVEQGTEVINFSNLLDINVTYGITDRIYGTVLIPFVHFDRSSMYEHGGNPPNGLGERHITSSYGLADIRFGVGYWLFDPIENHKFNYAVGLGLKIPTGKYNYTDNFYNQGPDRNETLEAVVDQSIQPGDGGVGITLDFQGNHFLSDEFVLSTFLYYMFNVTETNGVLIKNKSTEFSSPDQFAALIGVSYLTNVQGLTTYLGGRVEGVPSSDIIGGSAGYRRPGYAVSVEPGISFVKNSYIFNLSVPVAVYRNRIQSFIDKERTRETGVYTIGDAAFADYLINFSIAYQFGGKRKKEIDSQRLDFIPD
jgi:hypothetical protein